MHGVVMFNVNFNSITNKEKVLANNHELNRQYRQTERKRLQELAINIDSQLTDINLNGLFVITIRNNSVIDIKELNK